MGLIDSKKEDEALRRWRGGESVESIYAWLWPTGHGGVSHGVLAAVLDQLSAAETVAASEADGMGGVGDGDSPAGGALADDDSLPCEIAESLRDLREARRAIMNDIRSPPQNSEGDSFRNPGLYATLTKVVQCEILASKHQIELWHFRRQRRDARVAAARNAGQRHPPRVTH